MKISIINVDYGEFLVTSGEFIAKHLFASGKWEQHVIEISKNLLANLNNIIVLDIGANFGAYSIPIAKLLIPNNGNIIAFEPQRKIYNQLCGNIFLNDLVNVYPRQMAVGAKCESIQAKAPDYDRFQNHGAYSLLSSVMERRGFSDLLRKPNEDVQVINLDSLADLDSVALIKIDVEGMELEVLQGSLNFLASNQFPPIIFEMWDEPESNEKNQHIINELTAINYSIIKFSSTEYLAQNPRSWVRNRAIVNDNGQISFTVIS
jgi:FkbM family methyltransferase